MLFKFFETADSTFMSMGVHHQLDLCARLHLAGIYTEFAMTRDVVKQGRFRGWRQVPPTVSVTLVVPREKNQVLLDMDQTDLQTPMMQASILGREAHSYFASIKMGFGAIKNNGTDSDPRITFDADPTGWTGTSPLVMSFSVPSLALVHLEDPEDMTVAFSFRSSCQTIDLVPILGIFLHIFTAPLMDTSGPRGASWVMLPTL